VGLVLPFWMPLDVVRTGCKSHPLACKIGLKAKNWPTVQRTFQHQRARKLGLGEALREIARAQSLAAKNKCAGLSKTWLLPAHRNHEFRDTTPNTSWRRCSYRSRSDRPVRSEVVVSEPKIWRIGTSSNDRIFAVTFPRLSISDVNFIHNIVPEKLAVAVIPLDLHASPNRTLRLSLDE
jgi:hypothetical protein